jgi:hypothetical protein
VYANLREIPCGFRDHIVDYETVIPRSEDGAELP